MTSARPPAAPWGLGNSLVFALVAFLTGLLVPAWAASGTEYVPDFLAQIVDPWLLPALGLLWVIRCGSMDLSVWVGFSMGWAVAAAIVTVGGHPLLALAGVLAVGLALGLVNAAAVAWGRLPGWGVTGVTAVIGLSVAGAIAAGLPPEAKTVDLGRWSGVHGRLWATGLLYILALLVGLISLRGDRHHSKRLALAAAMVGSGVLSAVGGLCGLARGGYVPVRPSLVGDLRVLAAVVLAGAMALRGPGSGLLAALLLPPAMLLATIWRQRVWDVPAWPFGVNVILLAVMALGIHRAILRLESARSVRWAVVAAFLGIGVVAVTANDLPHAVVRPLRLAGAGIWAVAMIGAFAGALRRRKAAPSGQAPPASGKGDSAP